MRLESAAMAKGCRRSSCNRAFPTPGSRLRQVFDLFLANKGLPIACPPDTRSHNAIRSLIDFYGLDIRYLGRGQWVLAGEWQDRKYFDFIAEKIAASDREAAQ